MSHSEPNGDTVLACRDIRKTFGGAVSREVLHGVSLDFPRGQFAAIVGPSGGGKSTLLYILGALDKPTSGQVFITGQRVDRLSQGRLARMRNENIGFVFQFHFLLPEFTALENVLMPSLVGGAARTRELDARGRQMLERFRLEHHADTRITSLSGGEQQRVAIARALMNEPALVLCDEPTGNLDTSNAEAVYELLRELNLENRQTILVVTHDTGFAAKTDRIINLVDGEVEEDRITGQAAATRA